MSVKLKRSMSFVLALLLCVAAFFTAFPAKTFAAENTVEFEPGYVISYGSYGTTKMSIDGGACIAYCVEPYKKTPIAGTYSYQLLGNDSQLRKALYYLQGGPKYEQIQGAYLSGWSEDNAYVIGHLVVSYINDGYSTAEDAFYGAPASYQSKAIEIANAIRGMADPTPDFKAFIVYSNSGAQTMVGTWYQRYGWIELKKTSANANVSDNNSNYSLKGAEYGVFMGERQVTTLVTDENGYAKSEAVGIGDYTIRELNASAGYAIDTEGHDVTVTDEQTSTVEVTEVPQNYLTDILGQKIDSETGEAKAQGAASLADAEFTVKYYEAVSDTDPAADGKEAVRTWILKTDENAQIRLDAEHLVSGDAFYTDTQGNNCLPIGTITIQETKAPTGYFADEETFVIKLAEDGEIETIATRGNSRTSHSRLAEDGEVETIATVNTSTASEQVYRGDLEFVKVSDGDLARLANVPFTITSKTTGESHTIVTDENGYASTAASWVKHTANTNEGGSSEDGIWFGSSDPDDSKGALIYDTYVIEEQRCDANKGMDLLKTEVKIHKDSVTVQMGTLTDDRIEIGTTAMDEASGTHYAKPAKEVTIIDTVSYEGLKKGQEYKLVGKLMDQETGEVLKDADGKEITAETSFKAKKKSGEAKVTFTIDASSMAGKSTVVFEDLYYGDLLLTTHADLENQDQTIYFPEIGTTATNDKTRNHTALAEKEVTLTDVVAYKGLVPGTSYTVTGTLMDKETGKAVTVDGEKIMAETEFTPETDEGSVELHFTFDGTALAGKTVVAFESVKEEKNEIAVHADINDVNQTIYFPEIHTSAKDKADQDKEVEEGSEVTIIDTVSYSNLTVGETYHVTGTLMDKENGKAIQKDGKDVTAEAEFTAEKAEGTVDVEFTFNTTDLGGHSVVVFEEMTDVKTGAVIAEHKDLEDKDQTITVKQKPETPEQPKTEKPTTPSNESPKGTTVTAGSPKTGDDSNMILWAVISGGALLAGAGLTGSLIRRRKNEK